MLKNKDKKINLIHNKRRIKETNSKIKRIDDKINNKNEKELEDIL